MVHFQNFHHERAMTRGGVESCYTLFVAGKYLSVFVSEISAILEFESLTDLIMAEN